MAKRTKRVLYNRFAELLAAKERREGRKIPQREIADEIGVALNTVNTFARNTINSYLHRETIEKLMDYFNVDHSEFFETLTVEEDEDESQIVAVA